MGQVVCTSMCTQQSVKSIEEDVVTETNKEIASAEVGQNKTAVS
jgi:hypothetical protein